MLVFDTSAFLNGWRDHLPPETFPGPWALIAAAVDDGRIIMPRAVYRELMDQDDEITNWAKQRKAITEPSQAVQREAGHIYPMLPNPGQRHRADPFIVAEAKLRGLTVVTYEGRSFSGKPRAPTKWDKSMPGICERLNVPCRTLAEALTMLGGKFH